MATVLLIVGNPASLTAADTRLRDDILAAGHSLGASNAFIVDDGAVVAGDLTGKDVVVLSPSTSSTTVNNQVGSALAAFTGIVLTLNDGFGIIPTLGIAFGNVIGDYRSSASTVTLVDIPDTLYDDGLSANDVSWFSPGGPGSYLRAANLGTGAVLVVLEVNQTATAGVVVYPAGSVLADQVNKDQSGPAAPGPRAFINGSSWANRSAAAEQLVFDGVLATLLGSVGPTPTVAVRSRTIVEGQSVQLTAEIGWGGADTTAGVTWSTTDPAGVGTIEDVGANPAVVTPTVDGATYTCTVVGTLGGQASATATVTLFDTARQQVAPATLSGTAGVQAAGGGTPLATALADALDSTAVDLTVAGDVVFVRLADLVAPEAGTGTAVADLHLVGTFTSAVVRVEVVNAGGITDAAARAGGGTVVGPAGAAAESTITARSPVSTSRALTATHVSQLDVDDVGLRVTLVSAVTA